MRRSPFRSLAFAALAAAALALCPGRPAVAEDEVVQPDHSASDMALSAEALHGFAPEGATLVADDEKERPAAEKAIKDAIEALATEAKVAMSEITTEAKSLKLAEGKTATFVLVDVYTNPGSLRKGLEDKAKASGWAFREMASPVRLLVVEGPADMLDKLVEMQVKVAGLRLAQTGMQRLQNHFAERAQSFAKTALQFLPGLGYAHLVLGLASLPTPTGMEQPPPESYDKSIAAFRLALEAKEFPLAAQAVTEVKGRLGDALLLKGGPSEEARDNLKYAVENAGEAFNKQAVLGWRYNLACAHGRLKELDPAFEHLKAVLEQDKKEKIEGISHWRKDPDFDNLHADPRWAEVLAAFPETPPPPSGDK